MTLKHFRSRRMSIEDRIKLIQDLIWKGVQDPRNRKLALEITRQCPERDGECEAQAIYRAIKRRVRYSGDVAPVKMGHSGPTESVDLYQGAHRTWEIGAGDCDDASILAATLLALNGITPKLRVTAQSPGGPWTHIYTLAGVPKNRPAKWLSIDTTLPGDKWFGRELPYGRKVDFAA